MKKNQKEKQTLVRIEEKINSKNLLSTTLILEVEYKEVNDGEQTYRRKDKSTRTIIIDKIIEGTAYRTKQTLDGFVTTERVMDIHTDNFLQHWSADRRSLISFEGDTI